MLGPPTIQLTLPSIHDSLPLDVRVYHPNALVSSHCIAHVTNYRKRAAIIAHPYAPLGGCYDDPVVGLVGHRLNHLGWVVVTFNFRGAMGSKGRTSWTSRPEQSDYTSVFAFTTYYMHHLLSRSASDNNRSEILSGVTPRVDHATLGDPNSHPKPVILLGGYSYGTMILTSLASSHLSILEPFQAPTPGSTQETIRKCALHLATVSNKTINDLYSSLQTPSSSPELGASTSPPRSRQGVRAGGDETSQRRSSSSSFSLEHASTKVKMSLDRARRTFSPNLENSPSAWQLSQSLRDSKRAEKKSELEVHEFKPIKGLEHEFAWAFLLISPIQGFVRNLASFWTFTGRAGISLSNGSHSDQTGAEALEKKGLICANDVKYTKCPTLAVFGDDDTFTGITKLRDWAHALHSLDCTDGRRNFAYKEVPAAGHFWVDEGAELTLQASIESFTRNL